MCSKIGTPKIIYFPFKKNGKLMVLGVPILKHFRVVTFFHPLTCQVQSEISLIAVVIGLDKILFSVLQK